MSSSISSLIKTNFSRAGVSFGGGKLAFTTVIAPKRATAPAMISSLSTAVLLPKTEGGTSSPPPSWRGFQRSLWQALVRLSGEYCSGEANAREVREFDRAAGGRRQRSPI